MGQGIKRDKRYPSDPSARSPHASGGGAFDASFTGAAAATLDCSGLAGRNVTIEAYVASSGADAAQAYKVCWLTTAEAAGSPGFASGDVAAAVNPAEGSKVPKVLRPGQSLSEVVDRDRPVLLYEPFASVSTAETISVVLDEPAETS